MPLPLLVLLPYLGTSAQGYAEETQVPPRIRDAQLQNTHNIDPYY